MLSRLWSMHVHFRGQMHGSTVGDEEEADRPTL